jgi:hypothetical protein
LAGIFGVGGDLDGGRGLVGGEGDVGEGVHCWVGSSCFG